MSAHSPPRWLLPAVFLVSAAALGYEILLMRLLSIVQWHHFAWMIISVALLGYGASGTAIALWRRRLQRHFTAAWSASALLFALSMTACFALGQRIPFNALALVWEPRQFLLLAALYLAFFVPFFFAAGCIGLALASASRHINRVYLADLVGAGAGALGILALLLFLRPPDALRVLAVAALAACALPALAAPRRAARLALPVAGAVVLGLLPSGWLDLRLSPYKGLSQALETVDARVLATRSGPLGLLTVVESPTVPFRHAPGLSFGTLHEPPEQLALFTDGEGFSPITRFEGDLRSPGHFADVTAALPYRLLERPRVLVLGAGGGTDVLMALALGAEHVDAVELNPQVVALVRDTYREFSGGIYSHPRVTVHVAEARGFVTRASARWDLIQVSLLDSFAASGSGVQSLAETYLYTVEALADYLRHLEPGGILAITRWLRQPPRDSLKLIATAADALRRTDHEEPGRSLAMIRSWNTGTLLVKNGTFDAGDIEAIRAFASSRSFDTAWYPGMPPEQANRYNRLPEPWIYRGAVALLGDGRADFLARYKFNVEPATDDRPYFFHFFKWSAFEELMSLREQGGAALVEWGYLILVATVLQAALAGAVLILLPLTLVRTTWPRAFVRRMGGYFFLVGLAFLFVEIAAIQKLILFLSHPLYAVAVVLAGFLVFAGAGSGVSARFLAAHPERTRLFTVVAAIVAVAVAWLTLLPSLFERLAGLGDAGRIAVALAAIAPLAFFMGMPFPIGLTRTAREAPAFLPWAWGINGFASVLSAALAALLAVELGFTAVIVTALLFYAAAALLIPRTR
ncbi:MAG TPA: spermidine synthase [Woeseiaceae bacterium]|nr:spermidine synthase [Woeseiaceae bacterium]